MNPQSKKELGTLTLFNTAEDAERIADECGLQDYKVRQILFDTDEDSGRWDEDDDGQYMWTLDSLNGEV